ncbi:MAG: hypothetical protein KKF46_07535 [Nanoarchaeota archaeon]|nr:hypothetical protein [Nanoarchaeota archaeon]MBU1322179.1 hypothetical protein [Nanoarchaeota archaeon]MBU1597720.1 hypothetical protein [Nanoarchaeota archaeon]MBU2442198.1 hypothetical protein [Nanoarchaeota archaeon]
MYTKIIIGMIAIIFSGCAPTCPNSCDDGNKCTEDFCSESTSYECQHSIIKPCNGNGICENGEYGISEDCPDCNDDNIYTEDNYNIQKETCEFTFLSGSEVTEMCFNKYHTERYITECLYDGALETLNPNICNEIKLRYVDTDTGELKISKELCIAEIAFKKNDYSLLRGTILDGINLIQKEAIENEDYKMCELMEYVYEDKSLPLRFICECFYAVYDSSNIYTTERCVGVSEYYQKMCLNIQFPKCYNTLLETWGYT